VPRKWYKSSRNTQINPNSSLWMEGAELNRVDSFKFHILKHLIDRNRSILYSEPDIVWMSPHAVDYIQFKMANSLASVAFAQDQFQRDVSLNSGFFYALASTNATMRLFGVLINECNKSPEHFAAENAVIRRILSSNIQPAFNWTEIVGLDPLLYASHKLYIKFKLNDRMGVKPFVVHADFSHFPHKNIRMMKDNGLWLL
jgi:hypothetical protein